MATTARWSGRQAMADSSLWLVLLTLGLLVSSCAMAHQAPDFARPPVQSRESCAQWCVAVVATCMNRCQRDRQECQHECDAQRSECLKSCDLGWR